MLKKTELREAVYNWIEGLPHGVVFAHEDAYHFLEENFGQEISQRGDAAKEPRYKNDARWAAHDAKHNKLMKPTKRGRFQRL